ncbi:MAG: hypothetical protein R3247_17440, partial [Rhodothermales bacterium]|nr:hypothetical protein [Rhodothermales bacterium]
LLWAWPTHGVASVALVRRAQGRGLGVYLALAAVAALAVVVGWPLWPQSLPVPILPLVLLLAVRSGALAWFRLARARATA